MNQKNKYDVGDPVWTYGGTDQSNKYYEGRGGITAEIPELHTVGVLTGALVFQTSHIEVGITIGWHPGIVTKTELGDRSRFEKAVDLILRLGEPIEVKIVGGPHEEEMWRPYLDNVKPREVSDRTDSIWHPEYPAIKLK